MSQQSIAIIGAGMSGLSLARMLETNFDVTLFEKARGPGGRLASRRHHDMRFDFGVPFFRIRKKEFSNFLRPYMDQGVLQTWSARFVEIAHDEIIRELEWGGDPEHWVGAPSMNALAKSIASGLNIQTQHKIEQINRVKDGWQLMGNDQNDLGTFDWVVSTAPSQQSALLLPSQFNHLKEIQSIQMVGCYALMLELDDSFEHAWDVAHISGSDLSWISINSTKPDRVNKPCVVALSTNLWAEEHMELELDQVKSYLVNQLQLYLDIHEYNHIDCHRWRFANIQKQQGLQSYVDKKHQLAACGDWCIRGFVENAFLSARDAASQILQA